MVMYDHGKSDDSTVPMKLSNKGGWCAIICGGSRGKGVGQGESGSAKQGPHSEAGRPAT